VLVAFVIAHMLGNLKIFSGPNEINAYIVQEPSDEHAGIEAGSAVG
jgi:hypothetical protein